MEARLRSVDLVLDGLLAGALPLLAWRVVDTRDLSKAIVLFIALGLLVALAWARLAAPDVALVEAAVGAGLTGSLLMNALGWLGESRRTGRRLAPPQRLALALLLAGIFLVFAVVLVALSRATPSLTAAVLAEVPNSGVSHPVTAVLLNFRGYDTLLEMVVLLVAAVAVRAQARVPVAVVPTIGPDPTAPLLPVLVRLLIPGMILVAGYLLWRGSSGPGGAFQGGAVLGGGGILLILARVIEPPSLSSLATRAGLVAGPAVFLLIAVAPLLAGASLLEYPRAWAGTLILTIETALTVSIALMLTMFFPGLRSERLPSPPDSEVRA